MVSTVRVYVFIYLAKFITGDVSFKKKEKKS